MRKDIIYLSAIAVIVFMLMADRCATRKGMYEQSVELSNYKDTAVFYHSKSGRLIASNKALKINRKALFDNNKELKKEVDDLRIKNPSVIIKTRTETRIDSILIPFEVQLPCDTFTRAINIDSTFYKIKGILTEKSLLFNTISIPNEQAFIIGDKRDKWYKPKEYTVAATNSNPYVITQGLQAYTFTDNKKFYEKTWFHLLAGAAGGVFLSQKLQK